MYSYSIREMLLLSICEMMSVFPFSSRKYTIFNGGTENSLTKSKIS